MSAPLPSDRSFGLTFAVVFALLAGWLGYKGSTWWLWSAGASAVCALLAVTIAHVLHPFNVVWMRFGALLHSVVSPVILGVIFFCVITPVALVFKARGRDVLTRRFDPSPSSYWVPRTPPGPDAVNSFPRQY